jgi:hypothetical protein|tara:strand:+ start:110 stop:466 length:357 start_codon:yes stop_codon:yes gene_type:complete
MLKKQKPRPASRGKTKPDYNYYIRSQSNRKRSFADYVLPAPVEYYSKNFSNISTNREWAKVLCPFHDDHKPSLSINLREGFFKCHSCDAKGGGVVKFHMMKNNLPFKETIKQLEGGQW